MSEQDVKISPSFGPNDKPWRCECGFVLGVLDKKLSTLRIKYKDLYLTISGDDVVVSEICRRCSRVNTLNGKSNTQVTQPAKQPE